MDDENRKSSEKRRIIIEMIVYSQIVIFAPFIFFVGLGFLLYLYSKNPVLLFISVGIAFIFSVFLLIKKATIFIEKMKKFAENEKSKK